MFLCLFKTKFQTRMWRNLNAKNKFERQWAAWCCHNNDCFYFKMNNFLQLIAKLCVHASLKSRLWHNRVEMYRASKKPAHNLLCCVMCETYLFRNFIKVSSYRTRIPISRNQWDYGIPNLGYVVKLNEVEREGRWEENGLEVFTLTINE